MRILKVNRFWPALVVALGAALVIVTAASADSATGTAVQTDKGTATPICHPAVSSECVVIGFEVTGEKFAGTFGAVEGSSAAAAALRGSRVLVDQSATIYFVASGDPTQIPFVGFVSGLALIKKGPRGQLTATYSAGVAGVFNSVTGGLSVQWQPGATYTVNTVTGIYDGPFASGDQGSASATATSVIGFAPEVGQLTLTFNTN